MKFKLLIIIVLIVGCVGFASAKGYIAEDSIYPYEKVENYSLNGFDFRVLSDYKLVHENDTHMFFKGDNNTLNISVVKNGKIKKVNSTQKVKSSKTMMGSTEGYLVDRNGNYTFSFYEGKYLVTVSSKDMRLMMEVIGPGEHKNK